MFGFFKKQFSRIYETFTSKIGALFGSSSTVDQKLIDELYRLFIAADMGPTASSRILEELKKSGETDPQVASLKLKEILITMLEAHPVKPENRIIMVVGINGSGKTTTIPKLANLYRSQGKKVLIVAADTFRAAAQEQLGDWCHKLDIPLVAGKPMQDPSSVIYEGITRFKNDSFDIVLIDTAGRLQTKQNLMKELEKMHKTIAKVLPNEPSTTYLVLDSMLGQNSFEQARLFNEVTPLSGVIVTKFDGTAKGGIIFPLGHELNLGVAYMTFGENVEAIKPFVPRAYVEELLETK